MVMKTLPAEVMWHDLECGSYRADLPLWRELAGTIRGPVLDVGAGTGRVTLDLARAGHRVTALDIDPYLLGALGDRTGSLQVETVHADARSFDLHRSDFALCLVPMQTLQLQGGSTERAAFLRRAHAHLRPGGLLACAIVTTLEPFDCAGGDIGPTPETAHVGDTVYVSCATRVGLLERGFTIERERRIIGPGGDTVEELNIVELDRVSPSELQHEATVAGLSPEPAREIPSTADHVGSTVVMLRA
jgi:SAM-dependent methyltransferase